MSIHVLRISAGLGVTLLPYDSRQLEVTIFPCGARIKRGDAAHEQVGAGIAGYAFGGGGQDRIADLGVMKTPISNTVNYLHAVVDCQNGLAPIFETNG